MMQPIPHRRTTAATPFVHSQKMDVSWLDDVLAQEVPLVAQEDEAEASNGVGEKVLPFLQSTAIYTPEGDIITTV